MPSWIAALKTYNSRQPAWCIPRKGTDEYNKVRKIMNGEKTKKPKILKPVDSFKKQDDIYEEPRNIQRTPTAVINTKRATINDVPQDVMNHIMGTYLGVADKANLANIGVKIKVTITDEEKRVKQLKKLIQKLQAKNTLDKIFEDLPTAKKYNSIINKYRSKINDLVKLFIEKTFDDKNDVFVVNRGKYSDYEWTYKLVIFPNFNQDKAEELSNRQITLDNLKPYLKIKKLTPEENDLITKTLNTEKPDLSKEDSKELKKEKKAVDDAGDDEKNRRNILTKLMTLRTELLKDANKYDEFVEINKILRSLTPISFYKYIVIYGEKTLNYRYIDGDGGKSKGEDIWRIRGKDRYQYTNWKYIIRDDIKIKKKIPTKLQNMINKYI